MSRLTAAQATDIARAKDPAFAVDTILAEIAKAADAGKYEYTTRAYGFGESTYCTSDKYPELCKAILKDLRALGFQCQCQAQERQFVDMWLLITWGDTK